MDVLQLACWTCIVESGAADVAATAQPLLFLYVCVYYYRKSIKYFSSLRPGQKAVCLSFLKPVQSYASDHAAWLVRLLGELVLGSERCNIVYSLLLTASASCSSQLSWLS